MGDHERRDVRRVLAGPGRDGALSFDGTQRQVMAGPNGSPFRRQSASTPKEASGNTFDPASPSPGQGKRPQQAIQGSALPRPVVKRQKVEQELNLHVLLPNGTSLKFFTDTGHIQSVEELLRLVEAHSGEQEPESSKSPHRTIAWGRKCWIEDYAGNKLNADSLMRAISAAKSGGSLSIILHDGDANSIFNDKNMWNVTPKPEMLGTLPQGYTLETALADQVDNALQAVWGNKKDDIPEVRVTLGRDTITVFDTGQGMDGSPENCIANWGTVGGSNHRAVHHKALGGEPPYLKPYLGKYGAGGIAAALHLGSCVRVCSKTKASKRVAYLMLEQKVLLEKTRVTGDRVWQTGGGFRDMTEEEKAIAPHGSFTMVEISKLKSQYCVGDKQQYWKVDRIRQLLKDIYFPYIQMELSSSSKTVCLVKFQVNDKNLVEVMESETAILKMHTCNGVPFKFNIHMQRGMDERDRDEVRTTRGKLQVAEEANAQVTCHYYPNKDGKEALETVLKELKNLNPQNSSTFETMPRVTVRWLGRLLPEGKWPILPFMEVTSKKEQKLGVRRPWAKRVRAFVDTDAGFHPNQSKTELERDQPFAVALKATGSKDFSGTSAEGVVVNFTRDGKQLSALQLTDAYMEWVKKMHSDYDEDFKFEGEPTYAVNQPNAQNELGLDNEQVLLVFHKHMKDTRGDFKVDPHNPVRIKLPKGANGLKSELYATVEFFFHDAAEENGEVKFICRPLGVPDSDGSKIIRDSSMPIFQLNKSLCFPAALLSADKLLDAAKWKKRIEDLSNKSPGCVEILTEDDIKKLEMSQKTFPADKSKFYAGYSLPKEFLVVVRPKKGTGPSHKQGMIVPELMHIFLTVTHCKCPSPCWKREAASSSGKSSSPRAKEDHGEVVSKVDAQAAVSQSGVKGLYVFSLGSSEASRLTAEGIYSFHISVEGDKCKGVLPAVSCIQIVPSKYTSKWTICCHAEDCKFSDHSNETLRTAIKLNERLYEDLFIQKYDEFDNRQTFEKPLELGVMVSSATGKSLEMRSKIQANFVKANSGGKHRLQIKNLLFKSGVLAPVEPAYEGVLRASFPKEQYAEIKCKVLPGSLVLIQVKDSKPSIPKGSMCFQEALKPGEIIKKLTLQGLDDFGNKIDKGQKVSVQLEGLEWQDNNANSREFDDHGCLQLGGLLKVSCHYNASGSISIISIAGKKLSPISFQTVTRQLHVTGVPCKSFVGRQLEGVSIEIADQFGNIDTEVDGHIHSLTVDWMKGVTCPFVRGECLLPDFKLPEKPGNWEGKVYFSANRSLSATIAVQLELATACSLGPPKRKPAILKAQSGVPFTVPFSVFDDMHQPAVLTETMKQTVDAKAEAKDPGDESRPIFRRNVVERKDIKQSRTAEIQGYEAVVVISGSVGTYQITLMDTCFNLNGQVETTCNLEHGHITRLVPAQPDETHGQSLAKPLTQLEVKRCSLMPRLTVTLLDSADNLCISSEKRIIRMKVVDCPEWNEKTAEVFRGVAYFDSCSLVVPVGSYQVSVELDSSPEDFYSLDEQVAPIAAQFALKVCHGNYPSALTLQSVTTVSVSLTEAAIQYLPSATVFVESADGMRLQSRPTVGVRLHGDNSISSGPKEYYGTFVESFDVEPEPLALREDDFPPGEAGVGSSGPVRYDFSQVCVPSVAGAYVMEFFVPGTDLLSQSQHLIVRHGPPARLEIIQREPGQEMDVLQVNLVDGHGNTCEDIFGLEVALELVLSKNFAGTPGLHPCDVYSKAAAVVNRGKGDFGVFQLRQGLPGMYTLRVFGVDSYTNSPASLTPAEAQIFIAQGNICETIQQQCATAQTWAKDYNECLRTITLGENALQQKTAAKHSLEERIRQIEADLRHKEGQRNALRREQEAEHDDEIIGAELAQPLRNEEVVVDDIRRYADRGGNDFALALLDAQSEGNFLSPQSPDPAARDILGLVVMLGRVESEALNRALSEFLGVNSLLLVICRSQSGLSALEQYDEHGNIDESKGLYGFARLRRYRLPGRYDGLPLRDIRPYWRRDGPPIDTNHPQRLLNIDPPVLPSGQVPAGFLGYAVNFVHMRSEHLQIREVSRQGQEIGLRETLFFSLLGFLQVYDTRSHMIAAKDALKNFSGAVSLDGGNVNKNMRQRLGRRSDDIPLRFGTVPAEERRALSLLPPACHAFYRSTKMNLITREMEAQQDSLATVNQRLSVIVQELEHYKKLLDKTKTLQKEIIENNERTKSEIAELMKMKNAIAAKNASVVGTPGNSNGSQDSDGDKMRAFMM